MAYKPFAMPEDLHAWLKARAEQLSTERGTPVSMNDALREAREIVEIVESAEEPVLAKNAAPQPKAVQP